MPGDAHLLLAVYGRVAIRGGRWAGVVARGSAALVECPAEVEVRSVGTPCLAAIELPSAPEIGGGGREHRPFRVRQIEVELAGALVQAFTDLARREVPPGAFAQIRHVLRLVLSAAPQSASGRMIARAAPAQVHDAAELMVDELPLVWTAGLIASRLRVSRSTLHAWFKAAAGCGTGEYLREHRAYLLLDLVSCGCFTLDEAARAAGLKSARAAREFFERSWGLPLGVYLRRVRGLLDGD